MAFKEQIIYAEQVVCEATKRVKEMVKEYQLDRDSKDCDYWGTYKVNLMCLAHAVADAIKVMPCHTTKDCPPPTIFPAGRSAADSPGITGE